MIGLLHSQCAELSFATRETMQIEYEQLETSFGVGLVIPPRRLRIGEKLQPESDDEVATMTLDQH
jgi:hypothetical protein